jgi:hypothetical protein
MYVCLSFDVPVAAFFFRVAPGFGTMREKADI